MRNVFFCNHDRNLKIKQIRKLKQFLPEFFSDHGKVYESVTFIFCSDEYLLEINKSFLKHDFYTDIITFDLGNLNTGIIGEIYISLDRVKENSSSLSIKYELELHRVIFHGLLHLCGLKDKTNNQIKAMRKAEELYLNRYFSL
jgi:rRNA maturation RNase YbeY